MCSLNDCSYDDNDELHERAKNLPTCVSGRDVTLCRKCRCKNIDVLLVGQSGYCETCFLTATNHKFRAALGKSKAIRYGDSVLVDYSGGLNSTVLLHLIKAGMSESTHKKFMFKTVVLYVDAAPNIVARETSEERQALRSEIIEQIKNFGFTGYVVSLSEVLKKEDDVNIQLIDQQEVDNENDNQLCTMLAGLPDDTSRIDLLDQLHRKLLITAARKLNCNKIFQADSATDIAAKVVGNICLGRSAQLSTLANFCDARCADVKILKPMRDFMRQELLYYSEYHHIDFLKSRESNVKSVPTCTSIQALACNFTTGLESQFSGTVSVISRTAEKLSVRGNEEQDVENNCVLCDAKLNFMASQKNEVSATRALEVSKLVSSECTIAQEIKEISEDKGNNVTYCKDSQSNEKQCCCVNKDKYADDPGNVNNAENNQYIDNVDNTKRANHNRKGPAQIEDIWRCLCYSCRLIFRNSDILDILPASLLSTIEQRLALRNMKKEIEDFLL